MKYYIFLILTLVIQSSILSQDWKNIPIPVVLEEPLQWKLHPQSDGFNYTAPALNKGAEFAKKWTDGYHNPWKGPGLTEWSEEGSQVIDGYLKMVATRKKGSKNMALGCITSKQRVKYPVYVETKVKISNSVLASNVWMLSPDDTQEIDIIEAYGGSDTEENKWFSERIHLSHHMFIRSPFEDYQPSDDGSWYMEEGNPIWHDEFVRVGVYWKDPFTLEYYINGVLARVVEGQEMIDPDEYSGKKGIHKEMDIIINMEDQQWRLDQGLTPSNKELRNIENNTYLVDWIRIYTPVNKNEIKVEDEIASIEVKAPVELVKKVSNTAVKEIQLKSIESSTESLKEVKSSPYIKIRLVEDVSGKSLNFNATANIKRVVIINQKMKTVKSKKYDNGSGSIDVANLANGYYKIKLQSPRGGLTEYIYRKKS